MKKAFTLSEILIVISVLIVAVCITAPLTSHIKTKKYTVTIEEIKVAFKKFVSNFVYKNSIE